MTDPKANRMTKGERTDLLSLIRKREKVMKTMAGERSAAMLAEFEAQAAKIYHWDDDAVWAKAKEEAMAAVQQAREDIAKRCQQLGIPPEFAPNIEAQWYGRGQSALSMRRAELRRAAKARIQATEEAAVARIEAMSLEAQTELMAHGIDTEAAAKFLAQSKASMLEFMPSLDFVQVEKMLEPHLRKQLGYH